jgi:hypothetical protein
VTRARLGLPTVYAVFSAFLAVAAVTLLVANAASGRAHLPPEWQFTLPLGLLSSALGWLLLERRPKQKLGWVVAALGATMLVQTSLTAYAAYSVHVHRLPTTAALYTGTRLPSAALVPVLATMFLLFPDGSLPSRRWRAAAWLIATSLVLTLPGEIGASPKDTDFHELANPLELHSEVLRVVGNIGNAVGGLALLCCALSVFGRWRRAHDDVTRNQIKGLLAAAALWPVVIVTLIGTPTSFSDGIWGELLFSIPIDAMVVAVTVAVLRYRLYEIDRLISRTLAYAAVTAVLAGGYIGCVALATRVLPFSSSVGVAASTLACAAAFNPLRRRVQSVVDRRFNRSRYDSARVVSSYRGRLRDVVDIDAVASDLLVTVSDAVQPGHVSLWVGNERLGREAVAVSLPPS